MPIQKIDMDFARYTLKTIYANMGLIMENLEDEHLHSKGGEGNFYDRMDSVYLPSLSLISCSIYDLLKDMEASI